MNNIQPTYIERVSYEMYNETLGTIFLEVDPIGWKSDNKEYARNEEYHGIAAKFSNNLTFLGDGADFINTVFDLFDVIGEIKLTRKELHPKTDLPIRTYWGYLDLSTREIEGSHVKLKFNAGGIEQDLKARENESVEIDRITTIDGKPIDPLTTHLVALDGRRIFLKSILESKQPDNSISLSIESKGNTRNQTGGIPLKIVNKSHEELSEVPTQSIGNEDNGGVNMMFFLISQVDRTLDIKIENLSFTTNVTQDDDINHGYYQLNLVTYTNGSSFDIKNRINLFNANALAASDELGGDAYASPFTGINNYPPITHIVNWYGQIDLLEGESIALEVIIHADLGGTFRLGHFSVTTYNITGKITIDEDSHFEKSTSNIILIHEALSRLATICTNKQGIFKSDYFGRTDLGYLLNGPGAYNGLTHGFWVRGFNKLPISDDNRFKPMTLSWKDAIDSLTAIHNVSIGIETINNKETIRVEDIKYFYQPVVTIKLPNQVKNVKRKVANKKYYGSIEIGYEKGGSYEEAQGLDEYNGKSKFTTIMKVKDIYSKLSKFRADSYGLEFARRKPYSKYSSTDTTYDTDIFILDLKKGPAAVFQQRKWQDDFEQAPIGTWSPETATNLRFSPLNMMLRHGWYIGACLLKYSYEFLRYASSTANSALITKLRTDSNYFLDSSSTPGNGNIYAENGNVLNSELKKAYFIPEEIIFEHECDFFTMEKIEGYTTLLNGKRIPNFYGMIEFMNENNELERGWFLNIKPNSGEFTIIKSNL